MPDQYRVIVVLYCSYSTSLKQTEKDYNLMLYGLLKSIAGWSFFYQFCVLIMDQMSIHNVNGITHSDEPKDNYHYNLQPPQAQHSVSVLFS